MNINDEVYVKLTPYGKKIHKENWDRYMANSKLPYKLNANPEGYTVFAMWDLMNIFGDCLYIGNTQIPFVNNEIKLKESK